MPLSISAQLAPFFTPRAVAVVGASRRPDSVGGAIFGNLLSCGFGGLVYAVNPNAGAVHGHTPFRSLADLPSPVDLAVVAVPAAAVESVIDACIAARIPAVVVISAGFGETGPQGRVVEGRLRDKVRAAGIRMIGPNCLGLLNASPDVRLNASFAPAFPPSGRIAFSSQSGALGLAILDYATRLQLGLSTFVSVGNKADVSTNDLLEYWETDSETRVILLYVESFGNPRRFGQVARRVARTKPIVAVKAGRSRAGARAATSHTGALAAADTFVDALFQDAGVVRTDTIEELFDVGALLAQQPLPTGHRVAILTNAGGPGILAADACEALGLALPTLSASTVTALRQFLMPTASVGNPVDIIATAPPDHFRRAIPLLLADSQIDALVTIFIPLLGTDTLEIARAVADTTRHTSKPVLATFFGAPGVTAMLAPVPCYSFPESAVRALAHAVRYGRWRDQPLGTPFVLEETQREAVRAQVSHAATHGAGWLTTPDTLDLLRQAGIPTVATYVTTTEEAAVDAFAQCGGRVVLKGSGAALLHKTEAHAVIVGLDDAGAVRRAYQHLRAIPEVSDVLVQAMVEDGIEMIVGATLDATFGHAVMCGSGGTGVEVLRDTAWRLSPLSTDAAGAMLDEVAGVAWLRGFRGAPLRDEAGLRDIVLRVSALVDACPEIAELDINPVIVTTRGAWAVDARIRLAPLARTAPVRTAGAC